MRHTKHYWLINTFSQECIEEVRDLLQNLDSGCEHDHYTKPYGGNLAADDSDKFKELKDHPLQCCSGFCNSKLRILWAGAVHYPALRTLLNNVYCARMEWYWYQKNWNQSHRRQYTFIFKVENPSKLFDDDVDNQFVFAEEKTRSTQMLHHQLLHPSHI